ncbi:hypothetical protein RIF23_02290 [Lipingzhangella sp. LS1_29]|uniref:Uncharacterized protein n=1 Tax=Lipingzhangella rawalii TaxID=2055835 RepID=A0ABU2H1E1_9ACTN|nr:hypothetical protein [Lipingzhangella rawalii]MDS1269121.1 hypothetical protein [Lipingzhangella rawalii]
MTQLETHWVVLIEEESNRQQNGRQVLDWSRKVAFTDQEDARAEAWRLAHTHVPQHPYRPQRRQVIRHSEDDYTVIVDGAMSTFHFRVQVGESFATTLVD